MKPLFDVKAFFPLSPPIENRIKYEIQNVYPYSELDQMYASLNESQLSYRQLDRLPSKTFPLSHKKR